MDFARPLQVYRELGMIVGPDHFPAVASLSAVAGPGDSTLVLFGLSLPATVLRFQRDEAGFSAEYILSLRLEREGRAVVMTDRRETVRVPSFAETGRTDESVLFQTALPAPPGRYELILRVRDGLSARGFEHRDSVTIPALGPDAGRVAAPVLAYRAARRDAPSSSPDLILNPRRTVPYGGAAPELYIEAYGPDSVTVSLEDEHGTFAWTRAVALEGADGFGTAALRLPLDSLPLGRFWLTASAGGETSPRVPMLVTISDRWVVANFDEVLEFLRYIATPEDLQELKRGTPDERRERWDAFWAERDPVPATPANEYREMFFERIRVATEQFAEGSRPGWRTDRGEVYIVLGPPSQYVELRLGAEPNMTGQPNAQEWVYERTPVGGRVTLLFVDRTGFGSYRLTAGSETSFRTLARRLRERSPGE